MRFSRWTVLEVLTLLVFLGPLLIKPAILPGDPQQGQALAARILEDIVARHDTAPHPEVFLYGHTPEEPAEYSYAVFSRDLKQGLYEIDVQIRWKAIPDTRTVKGSRPMEIHLGQTI